MGLTLYYKLRAPAHATDVEIRTLVNQMRARAVSYQRTSRVAAVGAVRKGEEDFLWFNEWLMVRVDEHTSRGVAVPVVRGWVFTVTLGEGSEPLRLGLCRYPTRVPDPVTGRTRVVRRTSWRLGGFCKTQYASLHGWENFRRSHTAAVDLLASLRDLGLEVKISDEGRYWPERDEVALRRALNQNNGIVAAFAGMMKDASDTGDGAPVQSPIFAHPQIERIEAEGAEENAAQLRKAAEVVRSTLRKTED